ncbi:UNVERIFIED_CONTAM: hypothetical protein FKN15_042926 [Acipenser sinensis]
MVARRQLWLSQARVPDTDKASLLNAAIFPGYTFGPAVEEMLQRSHCARESGNSDGNPELLHHRPLCPLSLWLLHLGQAGNTPETDSWRWRAVPGRDPSSTHNRGSISQTQPSRLGNSSSNPDGLQRQALYPFSQHHLLA